jgi:glycine/D-amino acid oxidase-like deaminating enzyme
MKVSRTIELDLLVVGGGIQGLTLLHHYTAEQRGSAVLVSRDELGKGETLHSHGYLHRGYFLPPDKALLIDDFVESFDWWDCWMRRHGIEYEDDASILFDLPEEQYEATTGIWAEAGLRFEPVAPLPEALQGGSYARPDHGRRLVRIHDRLIPAWRIVETMSEPLQSSLLQGEVTEISWDPGANRIVDCVVSTPEETIRFRPGCLVLATGRDTQRLLKKITGPDGARPLREELQSLNRIRDVPMILIKGTSLPALSGWFFPGCPITMMSHPMENGERMWVVTLLEGHRTVREDFEDRAGVVDEPTIRRTLKTLEDMIPELKSRSAELQLSSYVGSKIDHPEGISTWLIGDGGIENLRFVWPVLWGLAHSASRELIRGMPEPAFPRGTAESRLPTGVEVGEEYRLSLSRDWRALEDW